VTEAARDDVRRNPIFEPDRRHGVPQIVESASRQSSSSGGAVESINEAIDTHRAPIEQRGHQRGRLDAEAPRRIVLDVREARQRIHGARIEGQHAAASARLRCAGDDLPPVRYAGLLDPHGARQ
jgi:hypothetical protein